MVAICGFVNVGLSHVEKLQAGHSPKKYRLVNAKGKAFVSARPGKWGGHKGLKIYGHLDCPSALRWLAKGHYQQHRVFLPIKLPLDRQVIVPVRFVCLKSTPVGRPPFETRGVEPV